VDDISDLESKTLDKDRKEPKSYVERRLKEYSDRYDDQVDSLVRYQRMDPQTRTEGLWFRFIRWFTKGYQSERQRLETGSYLCSRAALASLPFFVLSVTPPIDSVFAVLTGMTLLGSTLSYTIYESALQNLEDEGGDCE